MPIPKRTKPQKKIFAGYDRSREARGRPGTVRGTPIIEVERGERREATGEQLIFRSPAGGPRMKSVVRVIFFSRRGDQLTLPVGGGKGIVKGISAAALANVDAALDAGELRVRALNAAGVAIWDAKAVRV